MILEVLLIMLSYKFCYELHKVMFNRLSLSETSLHLKYTSVKTREDVTNHIINDAVYQSDINS